MARSGQVGRIVGRLKSAFRSARRFVYCSISDCLVELRSADYSGTSPPLGSEFEIVSTAHTDLREHKSQFRTERFDDFRARIQHSTGTLCFYRGELVGYLWSTTEPRNSEGVSPFFYSVTPKYGVVYLYDLYTSPGFRGKRIATSLVHAAITDWGKSEPKGFFFTHDAASIPMRRLARRLGFEEIGRLKYLRIMGVTIQDTGDLEKVN